MALVGMTSLKLSLCCSLCDSSVYYNSVAEAIRLGAYCVQSSVAGCRHHSCVAAWCRKLALRGLLQEVGGVGGAGVGCNLNSPVRVDLMGEVTFEQT